jgi:hypothetical protein
MTFQTAPYRTILYIQYISYTAIHINTIPSPVTHAHSWINTVPSPVIHDHTFQLASPPNTLHLSSMSYPADYDGDDPPHSYMLLMTVMMKMTVMMNLDVEESGTMEI